MRIGGCLSAVRGGQETFLFCLTRIDPHKFFKLGLVKKPWQPRKDLLSSIVAFGCFIMVHLYAAQHQDGCAPLITAAGRCQVEAVRILCQKRADVESATEKGAWEVWLRAMLGC